MQEHCLLLNLKVLSIDVGNGIFNTFEMLKSIEVLGIQYNFVRVMVLSIQYFEMSIGIPCVKVTRSVRRYLVPYFRLLEVIRSSEFWWHHF